MERFYTVIKRGFLPLILFICIWSSVRLTAEAGRFTVSTIDMELKGSITIHKYLLENGDGDRETALVGTNYRLTYRNRLDETEVLKSDPDYYQAVAVTDRNGKAQFQELELGTYLVEETDGIPAGFEPCPDFLVSVPMTNQSPVTYDGVTYEAGTIWEYDIKAVPKNERIYGRVELTKYDAQKQSVLQGAVFQLFSSNGKPFMTGEGKEVVLVTDENGKIRINDLPYGNYYFQEMEAPDGYQLSSQKLFFDIIQSYREGEIDTVVKLEMENEKLPEEDSNQAKPPSELLSQSESETIPFPDHGMISVYENRPKESDTNGGGKGLRPTLYPAKTADETNRLIWVLLLGLSVSVLVTQKIRQKNKKQN